jgi:hypothetical protein
MKTGYLLLIAVFCLQTLSCKSGDVYKKDKDLSIIFGSGGGFTGATEQYEINGKGSLIKVSLPGDTALLPSISKSQREYLRQLVNSDSLSRISYNTYANMTSFIYGRLKKSQFIVFIEWG